MPALVDLGHLSTMFVVHITAYPIMNQSLALLAARVAVDLLTPQCASLGLCVRTHSNRYHSHILTDIENRGRATDSRVG